MAFAARDSSSPLFDAILSCPFALSVESVAGAEGIFASLAGGSATLVAFDDIFDDARIDDARVDDALLVSILRFLPQPCLLTWGTHLGRFRRTHREHGYVFSHFTLAACNTSYILKVGLSDCCFVNFTLEKLSHFDTPHKYLGIFYYREYC